MRTSIRTRCGDENSHKLLVGRRMAKSTRIEILRFASKVVFRQFTWMKQ